MKKQMFIGALFLCVVFLMGCNSNPTTDGSDDNKDDNPTTSTTTLTLTDLSGENSAITTGQAVDTYTGVTVIDGSKLASGAWTFATIPLTAYANKEITIDCSCNMKVVNSEGSAVTLNWQVNTSDYPIIASGSFTSGEWKTITGSKTLTVGASNMIYLSTYGLTPTNLSISIASLTFTITTKTTTTDDSDDEAPTVTKVDGKDYTNYTFTPATTYQTVDGIGAGFTYYTGWFNYQSSDTIRNAEFDALFKDAKMPVLRFMCKYEYDKDDADPEIKTMQMFYNAAKSRLPSGESPIVLMCCWSPKKELKSNGSVTAKNDSSGNAISSSSKYGTLAKDSDGYVYDEYAAWWAEAVKYYETNGIPVSYVSIQNEVDWATTYESCLFSATESGGYASYAKAFVAVYKAFQNASLTKVPALLGPETLTAASSNIKSYTDAILAETDGSAALAGIAHHLYAGGTSTEGATTNFKNESTVTPSTYDTNLKALYTNYPNLKRWQTEFFRGHAIQTASMINHCMTVEQAHAYVYWDGVWYAESDSDHFERDGLVCVVNKSGNFDTWVKHASYYAMRHFSEFIRPGYIRIGSDTQVSGVESSAYMKSDGTKVAVVLLNTTSSAKYYTIKGTDYTITANQVYQSTFGETCTSAGACWKTATMDSNYCITLPAYSVTTIDLTGTK